MNCQITGKLALVLYVLVTLASLSSSVRADQIIVKLNDPNQRGMAGNLLTFKGSISNVGPGSVTINPDPQESIYIFEDGPSLLDFEFPSPLPKPGEMLPEGYSSGDVDLFTVKVPLGLNAGLDTGGFVVVFLDSSGNPVSASALFSVTISSVPEPATITLLSIGLAAAGGLIRKRRQRQNLRQR